MNDSYKPTSKLINYFKKLLPDLRLDTRSLSIMRIGTGLVLLANLLEFWADFEPFFLDTGIIPNNINKWSLFSISPLPMFNHLLFIILAVSGFLFTFGYFTKVTGIVSAFLYFNLFIRNPYIVSINDIFISLTLFWLAILPCNLHLSLDIEKKAHLIKISKYVNAAYLMHLLIFYFLYLVRSNVISGQTIWFLKNHFLEQQSNTFLGQKLVDWPHPIFYVLSILTILTIILLPPAILYSQNKTHKFKFIISGLIFVTLMGIFKNQGLLPVTFVVIILGLLPAEFWEAPRIRITIADRTAIQANTPYWKILILFLFVNVFLVGSIIAYPHIFKPAKPVLWWQTAIGIRSNQEFLNLSHGTQPFSKQWPASFTESILNYRWLRLGESLSHVKNAEIIQRYSAPYCWQSKNLVFVQLFNYEQEIVNGGLRTISQKLLGQKTCN